MKKPKAPCVLYMSTFPPRECGIATFTQDLTNAIDKEFNPGIKSKILAMNYNGTSIYNYPRKVSMQINESDMEDYINRANDINKDPYIKLVNIQHEYGIFGGDWGNYLLPFLEILNKPTVLTMHTVIPRPDEELKKLTKSIINKVNRVIVMTKSMSKLLQEKYSIKKNKISIVPHGVHHIAYPSKSRAKKKLNLSGRIVLSTFGMLNRDKGIEYAIEALPKIVEEFPNVIYLILGATHPVVRREEGEVYRNKLKRIITKYKLEDNVKFYNKYLELNELIDFLKATDIYISPTLNPIQAVSGTISYALSCACPIISTANQYAKDVVNYERGILVKFKKSNDIKNSLMDILSDKKALKEMKKNSYFYSRSMTWQNVALSYFNIFNEYAKIIPKNQEKLPPINLNHIKAMTDETSIIQFANHTKPDIHSGYCQDDNSRALLGCVQMYKQKKVKSIQNLISTYFKFLQYTQKKNGKFHNFVSYNKTFIDKTESEDSFGRTIWSLGYVMSSDTITNDIKEKAKNIFSRSKKWMSKLSSLRSISFTILGLCEIEKSNNSNNIKIIENLSNKLVNSYKQQTDKDKKWLWFEDCLTYSNYKLSEALFCAYDVTKNKEYLKIAKESIDFLNAITFEKKDYFSPIGQDGWYFRNGKRAFFDQQPEDTASAVEANTKAYLTTKTKKYKKNAELAFQWFLGKNHLSQMVYDEATGGCYDGLGKYSINFNQGAESTLSYFLARLAIEKTNK